jgi:hypothetical protein
MSTEDFIKLIKEDKNAVENRDGYTPLFALAENIANGYGDVSSTDAEKLILSLDLSLFDVNEINTLNGFIYYSKISTNCILEKYFTYIGKLDIKKDDNLYIKGILMLFIIECDVSKFSSDDILEEKALREKFPWIWIDCISHYEWDYAKDDICNIFKTKNDEFKNLLCRLPLYKELDKKFDIKLSDSLNLWYKFMNESDKKELKKWTEIFDISFKEPILLEEKSDNIKYNQNSLLGHAA